MSLSIINTIWIGSKLGEIHAACLRSFLRQGHKVLLHCYQDIKDIPDGVEIKDANTLLPESRMIRYKNGSPAIFADLLRYEIQSKGLGLYVDCDMYCLQPINDEEYIFGWESDSHINNAVLKLPADSKTLQDLLKIKNEKAFVPPWAKSKHKKQYKLRKILGFPKKIEDMQWGTTGPKALTHYLGVHNEIVHAKPIDVFYPVSDGYLPLLLDTGLDINSVITPRTKLMHLWNGSNLGRLIAEKGIPESSPLGKLIKV